MDYKRISDVSVNELIYFCQRWWLVIEIERIPGQDRQTVLTLALPHSKIKQFFADSTFVLYKKQTKIAKQEFTRKEVIDWIEKTRVTFKNFKRLQAKKQRHLLRKGGNDATFKSNS